MKVTNRGCQFRGNSDKYKGVGLYVKGLKEQWKGSPPKSDKFKYFDTEKKAALYVDKCLIESGKAPINILLIN